MAIAAMIRMIATTMSNSISEKPLGVLAFILLYSAKMVRFLSRAYGASCTLITMTVTGAALLTLAPASQLRNEGNPRA
jgi:hypothetical protein